MSERRSDDPPLVHVNLLADTNQEFWTAVDDVNTELNARIKGKKMRQGERNRLLFDFDYTHFGLNWQDREVTVTTVHAASDEASSEERLGVETLTGRFGGLTTYKEVRDEIIDLDAGMIARGITRKVLAFTLDSGEQTYEIPFSKQTLLRLDADVERPLEEDGLVDKLKNGSRILRRALHSQSFLAHDLAWQTATIDFAIMEAEERTPIRRFENAPFLLAIADQDGYEYRIQGDHLRLVFPGLNERDEPYRQAEDYLFDELGLEVSSDDEGWTQIIPVSRLLDIVDLSVSYIPPDILSSVFDKDGLHSTIVEAEARLNALDDTDERNEAIGEIITDLTSLVPNGFFDLTFHAKGKLYQDVESNDREVIFQPATADECSEASACDFDIRHIDGRWRVVLPLEFVTGEFTEVDGERVAITELIYAIPSREYLEVLEAHPVADLPDDIPDHEATIDIVEEFENCEQLFETIVSSPNFRQASRETQIQMVKALLESTQQVLAARLKDDRGQPYRFNCATGSYREVPLFESKTCTELAQLPSVDLAEEQNLHVLEGDRARIELPELWDDTITTHLDGPKSFPLSGGKPMLIIDNHQTGTSYYVPISSIGALMPLVDRTSDE